MKTPGKVITFYSYKGGTGRSMCLANTAWLLASAGYKVLVIDWDLEAPGLHRYFKPFLVDPDLFETNGLIDAVWTLAVRLFKSQDNKLDTRSTVDEQELVEFFDDYICVLDGNFKEGSIGFIGAGRQDFGYAERVNTFDWKRFYELGGGKLFNRSKELWCASYDFVLIDSRTGVSDTSGICTIQIPDVLVACFTLNRQSIEGVAAVLASVASQHEAAASKSKARSANSPGSIDFFPLAMRIENAEKTKLDNARSLTRRTFYTWLPSQYKRDVRRYWDQMEITYWPFYAYEEVLAAFGDAGGVSGSAKTLLSELEVMARCITGLRHLQTPVLPDDVRRRVLSEYSFGPVAEDISNAKYQLSHKKGADIFISCSARNAYIAQVVSQSIRELSSDVDVFTSAALSIGADWHQEVLRQLSYSGMIILIYTPADDFNELYELGAFVGAFANVTSSKDESPRIVVLASEYERNIPVVLQKYYIISFKKELQKAGVDAVANLGKAILDLTEHDGIGSQDNSIIATRWAQHAADTIGKAMTHAYDDTILRTVDFQHRLVFTLHRSFDEDSAVRADSETFLLFGLTVDRVIRWNELKRSLLTDIMNRWWAEELEEMIEAALKDRSPAVATQRFLAYDKTSYRSAIEKVAVTRGGFHTVAVLLFRSLNEQFPSDFQVTGVQVLLAITKYQNVVQWALENSTITGQTQEDQYWRELCWRVKGVFASVISGGISSPEIQAILQPITARNDFLAQTVEESLQRQRELLAMVDKGYDRAARPERERLLELLNEERQRCSTIISELALEIGSRAERTPSQL